MSHLKNSLLTSDIHYLWNGNDFEGVILLKFINFTRNLLPKKLDSRFFYEWMGLSDFKAAVRVRGVSDYYADPTITCYIRPYKGWSCSPWLNLQNHEWYSRSTTSLEKLAHKRGIKALAGSFSSS